LLTPLFGLAVELDPGVKTVSQHALALCDIGKRPAFLAHLLDRFDLEFFGVTLTTHGTSYLGLIMRLGSVYYPDLQVVARVDVGVVRREGRAERYRAAEPNSGRQRDRINRSLI